MLGAAARELRELQQQCSEQTAEIASLKSEVALCKRKQAARQTSPLSNALSNGASDLGCSVTHISSLTSRFRSLAAAARAKACFSICACGRREGLEAWQRQKESQNEGAQIASLKSQLAATKLQAQEAEHQKARLKQRISDMEADVIKYKTREAQQHEETVNELIRKLKAAKATTAPTTAPQGPPLPPSLKAAAGVRASFATLAVLVTLRLAGCWAAIQVRLTQLKSERAEGEKETQRLRQAVSSKSHEAEAARMQLEAKESEAETLKMECHRLKQQIQHEQSARESQQMEAQRLSQALEALQHEATETHRALTAASAAASAEWEGRLKSLQQEAAHQQEETQRQAAEDRRRALEALREELRCLHAQEVELLRAQLLQREEDVEKVSRHCKTLTQKLEETASHVERLKAISRRDKMHIGELEGRLQGLREEQAALQQQVSLQQQQVSLLQQEKECLVKDTEAAQHRISKQHLKLQETQRALEAAEALARALDQEKQGLDLSLNQLQTENTKISEEASTYRARLVDLWRCLSSVCPAAQTLEALAGSSCPAVLWSIPFQDLQSCVETAAVASLRRADEQLRLMEDDKISLEARLAAREEELQTSRCRVRSLEAKAADTEKQTAIFCEERRVAMQQQLQQARRQHERELLETKAERLRREHEVETRRLREQLRELEEKTEADGQCMRARVAAAQQEAGALRTEVQQLCLEVESLQSEKQRLHEAIASVESDSRAMHGIFRRHMQQKAREQLQQHENGDTMVSSRLLAPRSRCEVSACLSAGLASSYASGAPSQSHDHDS
ncbi:hypothetical protein ACSSS7_005669 [Eimeria intestinalis]